jgi:hypothetical protein
MQWEYRLVALGLIVDATEQHQRQNHEQILNDLGREGWEAVAYAAQSDTVLLKRPVNNSAERKRFGNAGDGSIVCYTVVTGVVGRQPTLPPLGLAF